MLLLYHQNLEKKTVKSTQNIFIRSIGFFIRQGSCPRKASAAKKENAGTGMHPVRMILSSPFVPQPQRKTKHIFGQKGNSKLFPCVLQ